MAINNPTSVYGVYPVEVNGVSGVAATGFVEISIAGGGGGGGVTISGENYLSPIGSLTSTFTANAVNLATTNVTGILPPAKGGSGTSTVFTQGSILFAGASGVYSQDNSNFYWDDTNNSLLLGTTNVATTGYSDTNSRQVIYTNNSANASLNLVSEYSTNTPYQLTIDSANGGATTSFGAMIRLVRSRGTIASRTANQSGDLLGGVFVAGYGSSGFNNTNMGALRFVAAENWGATTGGTYFDIATTQPTGTSRTVRLRVDANSSNVSRVTIGNGTQAVNTVCVPGNMAIGSYATVNAAPSNSLIVSGQISVGSASPPAASSLFVSSSSNTNSWVDAPVGSLANRLWSKAGSAIWQMYVPPNSTDLRLYDSTDRFVFGAGGTLKIQTTSAPTATTQLTVSSSTQNTVRMVISGQEFYQAANTSVDGPAFICGVNRPSNRQLWLGDSAATAQNPINTVIRFVLGSATPTIDAVATDGTTTKKLTIGNAGGVSVPNKLSVGTATILNTLDVSGGAAFGSYAGVNTIASNVLAVSGGIAAGTATLGSGFIATLSGNAELGTSAGDYRYFRIGGGNSSGYLYGNFTALGDGIHTGYNYYVNNAGTGVIPNTSGATSRYTTGYGTHVWAVGAVNTAPSQVMYLNSTGLLIGASGTAANNLDVVGGAAFGSYAGVDTAPSSGIIVSGQVGVRTTTITASYIAMQLGNSTSTSANLAIDGLSTAEKCLYYYSAGSLKFLAGIGSSASTYSVINGSSGLNMLSVTASGNVIVGLGSTATDLFECEGNIAAITAGKGFKVKEGSNAKMGTATLVAGVVTVANTSVTATSRIFVNALSNPGSEYGAIRVTNITAGTSFEITSYRANNSANIAVNDTSIVAWAIFEPV